MALSEIQMYDIRGNISCYKMTLCALIALRNYMHEIETVGHNAFSLQPPLGCAENVTFEVVYMLILSEQVSWLAVRVGSA